MPDNSSPNPNSGEAPINAPASPAAENPATPINPPGQFSKVHLIAGLALAHGASFFLPWIAIFVVRVSGMHFANEGGAAMLLWFWPVLSAITFLATVTGNKYQVAAQMAGAVPFVVLGYVFFEEGNIQFLGNIEVGGWLGLVSGALLFVTSRTERPHVQTVHQTES